MNDIQDEVVTDVSEGGAPGGSRRLRVYDRKGDFFVDIPSEAKVTFGYFNPGISQQRGYGNPQDGDASRRTALRIWLRKDEQLAVFLDVKGFRDERVKLTRCVERVVVETRHEEDDEGFETFKKGRRELTMAAEPDTYQ